MTIHQPPTTGILHLSKLLLTLAQLLQAHGHVLRGWSDGRIVLGGVKLIPSLGHNLIGKWPKIRMVERSFHWFCKYTCQPSMVYTYVQLRLHVKKTWEKKGVPFVSTCLERRRIQRHLGVEAHFSIKSTIASRVRR